MSGLTSTALGARRGPAVPPWALGVGLAIVAVAAVLIVLGPGAVGGWLYRPLPLLLSQLLLGLINGAFYALLSLGLAIIFGMLNIINFAHGALFMVGAFVAWMLLTPNTWLGMISPGLALPE